jgi:hypothetical protein
MKKIGNEVMVMPRLEASIAVVNRTTNPARGVVWREVGRFFFGFTPTVATAVLEVSRET